MVCWWIFHFTVSWSSCSLLYLDTWLLCVSWVSFLRSMVEISRYISFFFLLLYLTEPRLLKFRCWPLCSAVVLCSGNRIEVFAENELIVNITHHELVCALFQDLPLHVPSNERSTTINHTTLKHNSKNETSIYCLDWSRSQSMCHSQMRRNSSCWTGQGSANKTPLLAQSF